MDGDLPRELLVETLGRALSGRPERIAAAWLFGSRARGDHRPSSDVDVAVLLSADPEPGLAGLPVELEDALQDDVPLPVQVVVLNRASPDFVHRVLRDGVLLLDRDPSRRVAFEVRRRSEYFDLLPYLDQYRSPSSAGVR